MNTYNVIFPNFLDIVNRACSIPWKLNAVIAKAGARSRLGSSKVYAVLKLRVLSHPTVDLIIGYTTAWNGTLGMPFCKNDGP